MPALLALLVSMCFTLLAVFHRDAALIAAVPIGVVTVSLIAAQAHLNRRRGRQ